MKLKDILRQYDASSLKCYARDWAIKIKEGDSQEELVNQLAQVLIQEGIERKVSVLSDEEYQVLWTVLEDQEVAEEKNDILLKVIQFDLLYLADEAEVYGIEEVKPIVEKTKTDQQWQRYRQVKSWFIRCQQVLVHYWAECSLEQFQLLLRLHPSYQEGDDIAKIYAELPISEKSTSLSKESIFWRSFPHSGMLQEYRQSQSKYLYYLPSREEIEELFEYDYERRDSHVLELEKVLKKKEVMDVEALVHQAWNDLSYGLEVEGVYSLLSQHGKVGFEKELREVLSRLDDSCRKFIYRGHRKIEQ